MHIWIIINGTAYVVEHLEGEEPPPFAPPNLADLEVKRVRVKDVEAFQKALESLLKKHKRKE